MHRYSKLVIAAVALLLVAAIGAPATTLGIEEPAQDEEERFRAIAVVMGARTRGRSSNIDIVITRWTTPEQQQELMEILATDDQDALRRALQDQEMTGWMRLPNTTRQELRYAWQTVDPETGGREIMLATDRIIPFVEAWNRPRTFDYDITLIEMELDVHNEGAGIAAVGVRFSFDEGHLTITNFGTNPVNLNRIRRTN